MLEITTLCTVDQNTVTTSEIAKRPRSASLHGPPSSYLLWFLPVSGSLGNFVFIWSGHADRVQSKGRPSHGILILGSAILTVTTISISKLKHFLNAFLFQSTFVGMLN